MKKKICLLMICLLAVGLLAGCGGSDDPYADYELKDYIKAGKYKGLPLNRIPSRSHRRRSRKR